MDSHRQWSSRAVEGRMATVQSAVYALRERRIFNIQSEQGGKLMAAIRLRFWQRSNLQNNRNFPFPQKSLATKRLRQSQQDRFVRFHHDSTTEYNNAVKAIITNRVYTQYSFIHGSVTRGFLDSQVSLRTCSSWAFPIWQTGCGVGFKRPARRLLLISHAAHVHVKAELSTVKARTADTSNFHFHSM